MEVVFLRSGETEDVTFKLGDYYDDPTILRYLERLEGAAITRIGVEDIAVLNSIKASLRRPKEVVFLRSGETEDITFKLGDYYDDPTILRYLERLEGAAITRIGVEDIAVLNSIKASVIQALQKGFSTSDEEG
ncbi:hypothetical protein BC332_21311 [Capsicum chinense]|nr:hypothetical protein BC332_21311 [Capsicum chinense]